MFYGTFIGFVDYHTDRGRDVSEYDEADVETKLLVASEWLDGSFASSFSGYKVGLRDQVREWPRTYAVDRDGNSVDYTTVPVEVEHATYEAALRELQTDGSLLVDYTPGKYKRVSIDGAVAVEYRGMDASSVQTQFPIIGRILSRLLSGSSSGLTGTLSRG